MEMEFLEVPVQKTRNVRFVELDTDFPPQFTFQPGGSDGNLSEIGSNSHMNVMYYDIV